MSNPGRPLWTDPGQNESPQHSSDTESDENESAATPRLSIPKEEKQDAFSGFRSHGRKGARSSWRTDAPLVLPEPESTPKGHPRTHDVRRELSELQGEYAKQTELLRKATTALKAKEKQTKKLEMDNQELESELKDLRAKLIDVRHPPEYLSTMQARIEMKDREIESLREELAQKSTDMETQAQEFEDQLAVRDRRIADEAAVRDRLLASMRSDYQSQLAAKEAEIRNAQEAARKSEMETKQRVEKEMERLCAILAQSSQKLTALQIHLKQTDSTVEGCVCKELIRQEANSSMQNLTSMLSGLRDDVLTVKFELEGMQKLFSEMQAGRGFQVTALLNRTLVLKPRDDFCLQQCIEGVREIKGILLRTKEVVAQIYTDSDF